MHFCQTNYIKNSNYSIYILKNFGSERKFKKQNNFLILRSIQLNIKH